MIRKSLSLLLGAVLLSSLLPATGCTPTYPAEKLPEAIKEVCKNEYDMDVRAARNGSTLGIFYPMEGLLDVGLGVSEDAWDTISNLILIASRIVLSTDADIKFYCVITQDPRLPELQVVIIKYVDDVKRSMYRNISRGESFKRTLFSINLTPQAKKERSVSKVFNKLGVEEGVRGKVMEEFFRSPPTELSDIGFWKDQFFLKDITLAEFLAAQIANRIKLAFRGEQDLARRFSFKNAEGEFIRIPDGGFFNIKFKIQDATDESDPEALRKAKVEEILRIANKVIRGYKFREFEYFQLEDQLENATLKIQEENIYSYERGGTALEEIVKAPAGYFMPAAAR